MFINVHHVEVPLTFRRHSLAPDRPCNCWVDAKTNSAAISRATPTPTPSRTAIDSNQHAIHIYLQHTNEYTVQHANQKPVGRVLNHTLQCQTQLNISCIEKRPYEDTVSKCSSLRLRYRTYTEYWRIMRVMREKFLLGVIVAYITWMPRQSFTIVAKHFDRGSECASLLLSELHFLSRIRDRPIWNQSWILENAWITSLYFQYYCNNHIGWS
jgi:hypothetical protein